MLHPRSRIHHVFRTNAGGTFTSLQRVLKNCDLELLRHAPGLLTALLRQELLMDVGQDPIGGDHHIAEVLRQLLIIADRKLDVPRGDARLLYIPGRVASELESLRNDVLENGSEIHWRPGADTLRVSFLLQEPADPTDWERQASLGALRLSAGRLLPLRLATLALARHGARSAVLREPAKPT